MTEMQVTAENVQVGDYLVGLDNGYVFEVGENDTPYYDGRFVIARGEGLTSIGFHTAQGEEGQLIVPNDMPITVRRD